jgi:hypothetical protein
LATMPMSVARHRRRRIEPGVGRLEVGAECGFSAIVASDIVPRPAGEEP